MDKYEKRALLGEGMFGVVHLAKNIESGDLVAMKRIRIGADRLRDGVHFTALREVKLLGELNHPNVLGLLDIFEHSQSVYMVLELQRTDLEFLIQRKTLPLPMIVIQHYAREACRGLAYLHDAWVLHRDVKPSNLLIGADARLVLADFGLAREFGGERKAPFTPLVVTRWYRAPELLFGAQQYGEGIDAWAMACVVAEMLLRTPLLAGASDIDQIAKVTAAFGSIDESNWPGVSTLPHFVPFPNRVGTPMKVIFPAASATTLDFLERMLTFDPQQRLTVRDALASHAFFTSVTEAQWKQGKELATQHVLQLPASLRRDIEADSDQTKRAADSEGDRARKKLIL